MVSLFGAFVFYSIWEVQARYSLSFLPWLMILLSLGISSIEEQVISKIKYNKRLVKVIPFIIIVVTLDIVVINFPKYTIKQDTFYDTRVNQVKTRSTVLTNLSEKKVEQTFKTDGSFNLVSIKFIKKNVQDVTNYQLTLYDKDKKIYQEEFTSDDVIDNEFKNFIFNDINPKGEEEYTISISSKDATDDNSLGIESFNYDPYKAYPKGNLYVNGEDTKGAMTFKVQDKVERSYTSKVIYISMSLMILLIEFIAIYPLIKTRNSK